jgi:hypothetical protein
MTDTIKSILDRIKNLNEYEIVTELPEGFVFNGVVPYDVRINKNKAIFTVYALDSKEASDKVNQYLSENTEF